MDKDLFEDIFFDTFWIRKEKELYNFENDIAHVYELVQHMPNTAFDDFNTPCTKNRSELTRALVDNLEKYYLSEFAEDLANALVEEGVITKED